MAVVMLNKPPAYFYPTAGARGIHPGRWTDPFLKESGEERLVLSPKELRDRAERNKAYTQWLQRRGLKNRQMVWQVVQIMTSSHDERSSADWWPRFQDCVFRVWLNPEYLYCELTGDFKGYYILCPEDSELVRRWIMDQKGFPQPPRDALSGERWVSKNKNINSALVVPVECCRHFRHETTAGQLPQGI